MHICAPYLVNAKARASQTEIAFDPFHVVKLATWPSTTFGTPRRSVQGHR
jgi:transposase